MAGAVAVLTVTGCTSTAPDGHRAPLSSPPAQAAPPSTPTAVPSATGNPRTPPQLSAAEETFIRAGGEKAPRTFPEIPRIGQGTLEVGVICSGSGTVDVTVGSIVDYTVVCANGDPGQLNEVGLRRSRNNVTVSVTTRTSGIWGLSVGWTKDSVTPG
ncbi:hypothetical protein GCM10018980_67530 [Streptomyces capoamus]|uniref:Uncharacterized protein n=1 Tax=Streptomyces capoamus TaxID=68183 RepID=A0A919F1Q8_9ACTN|nr:hypothetical protein [Streptomyces capoamus]GGP31645.1 hypothetical protein GCM10010501_72930 [Streptomyces libani subsp. rufus]GHG71855.1 hypothetical protein GCM10018980_67530 [Streptomyces capoamus]